MKHRDPELHGKIRYAWPTFAGYGDIRVVVLSTTPVRKLPSLVIQSWRRSTISPRHYQMSSAPSLCWRILSI